MHELLLNFIKEFNKYSLVKIEYMALDPFFSSSGKILYNAHIIYSPSKEYLINDYITGYTNSKFEETVDSPVLMPFLITRFGLSSEFKDLFPLTVFENLVKITVSNVGRFSDLKLLSPTDPFLSMFITPENIVYTSSLFQEYFLSNTSIFTPSAIHILRCVKEELKACAKLAAEYQIYSNRDKYTELLNRAYKTLKVYFIALKYSETGTLHSVLRTEHSVILSTLAQAAKPWDFVNECINLIMDKEAKEHLSTEYPTEQQIDITKAQLLLKQKVYEFLLNKLIGELNAA